MKFFHLVSAVTLSIIFHAHAVLAQEVGQETLPIETAPFQSFPEVNTSPRALQSMPLKPGDRLTINIAGFPDLSGEHVVASDGTIQVPLVGRVQVGNSTAAQVTESLTEQLRPFVRRPQVTLSILDLSPLRIVVTGAVVQPGPRLLTESEATDNQIITLSDAIALAGGITPEADLRNITIRRFPASAGRQTTQPVNINVDLWEAIQVGNLNADPQIFSGDEIIIPKSQIRNADQQILLASTVAPQQITIQVTGEVDQPGQIQVTPSSDVNAAVAAAGGLTQDADRSAIMLYRMSPDGSLTNDVYSFGEASTTLMQGDLVVVAPSRRGNIGGLFDFINRILNPFGNLIRIIDRD